MKDGKKGQSNSKIACYLVSRASIGRTERRTKERALTALGAEIDAYLEPVVDVTMMGGHSISDSTELKRQVERKDHGNGNIRK